MSTRTVEDILADLREVVSAAESERRNLTDEECQRYEAIEAELASARRSREIVNRQAAYETPVQVEWASRIPADPVPPVANANPLAYTPAALAQLADAIGHRRSARIDAATIQNAALTTGTLGQPGEWGGNLLTGPRMLHVAAGVPRQDINAVQAEFPTLTLPAATGAAAEGASLAEFDSSTGGTAVLGRFGRVTRFTHESRFGTSFAPIVAAHVVGIARDLDNALASATETAAGTAVTFPADGDVPAAIRRAIASVIDSTAGDLLGLVVITHPDDAHLLQDVSPTGGVTQGEPFQRFSGVLAYPTSAVTSGIMVVANLAAGARYFEAEGLMTATDVPDVGTDELTVATKVTAGFAITLAGGFAVAQDVVTP